MKARGWGLVTFTDHDTLDAYKSFTEPSPDVVRGVEIKIKPRRIGSHTHTHTLHVNIYRLSDEQFQELETIARSRDYYAFIDYLKSNRLPYVLNHPFWHEVYERPNWAVIPEILKKGDFPLTEYNWGRIPTQNEKVLELARAIGVPVWGASDNHVGKPEFATLIRGDTFEEVWDNAIHGRACVVRQHRTNFKGQVIPITDSRGYAAYVADTILRCGLQLISVTSKALREKPVILNSSSAWRNLLVRFATSSTADKICRIRKILGNLAVSHGKTLGPVLARPYVRSQERDLEAIEDIIDPLLARGDSGEYDTAITAA